MILSLSEHNAFFTAHRITTSDLYRLILRAVKSGELTDDQVADVLALAIGALAADRCVHLASAIATETGWPIIGYWRRDHPDLPIVHAAVVDPQSGDAINLLGARPIAELRNDLIDVVGPLSFGRLDPLELAAEEREQLLSIAAVMPWMPDTGTARTTLFDWAALVRCYVSRQS